jgi:hypothetical protein
MMISHERRHASTTHPTRQPLESLPIDRKALKSHSVSVLQDKFEKQQPCQECLRRDRLYYIEHERLVRFYHENRKIYEELRASVALNRQYEQENRRVKSHVAKLNSQLYEFQMNSDQVKQRSPSKKKTTSKFDAKKAQIDDEEEDDDDKEEEEATTDHIKRLRHEVQMYNRLVTAKQQQQEEKLRRKQLEFFL